MTKAWRTRRYYRVLYESPVVLRVSRAHRTQVRLAAKNVTGKLLDLSEGGCGVEVDLFLPKGTRVNVFLDRSLIVQKEGGASAEGPSHIAGTVVGSAVRGPKKFRLGIQFLRISKADRKVIAEFVKFHERRKSPRVEL